MSEVPLFSIIIPFKSWSADLDECLSHIRNLASKTFEVLLLPDDDEEAKAREYMALPLKVIVTGNVNPAAKRDMAAKHALGQYLAFLDDDAYPQADWLDVAERSFAESEKVAAIGGPGITPKTDPFWARVSGAVFLTRTSGGFPERYVPCPPSRDVEDWPSVNLIVRKSVFDQVGGFGSNFWPGEDTLFCRKIVHEAKLKIVYIPELVVYHHRRPGLQKHLRQVGRYGYHRGSFVKKYPENSRKLKYFLPSLWLGFILLGWGFAGLSQWLFLLYLAGWLLYFSALVMSWVDIQKYESVKVAIGAIAYIILTHLWYGARFVQGLFTKELHGSLGR